MSDVSVEELHGLPIELRQQLSKELRGGLDSPTRKKVLVKGERQKLINTLKRTKWCDYSDNILWRIKNILDIRQ